MLTTVQGVFRNGKVELAEQPEDVRDETQVIVTFLNENEIDLRAYGINREQAEELRGQLASFAEDWNTPEMDIYDDYDTAKDRLQTR